MSTFMKQFEVTGRRKPSETEPEPTIFRMKIFAPNTVMAKSRFWYYLSLLKKIKRANGEILETHELFEKNPNTVKNFGIWIRYDSRSGTTNMYKEYRDTTLTGAINQMYTEMASRHRARRSVVQIIRTAVVPAKACKRENTLQFHNSKIRFRLLHRIPRKPKKLRKTFSATKPTTFF